MKTDYEYCIQFCNITYNIWKHFLSMFVNNKLLIKTLILRASSVYLWNHAQLSWSCPIHIPISNSILFRVPFFFFFFFAEWLPGKCKFVFCQWSVERARVDVDVGGCYMLYSIYTVWHICAICDICGAQCSVVAARCLVVGGWWLMADGWCLARCWGFAIAFDFYYLAVKCGFGFWPPSRHFAGHVPKCLVVSMEMEWKTWRHGATESQGSWWWQHDKVCDSMAANHLHFNSCCS